MKNIFNSFLDFLAKKYKLFTIFNIPIYSDIFFPLVAMLPLILNGFWILALMILPALLLHELGHALVAKHFGYKVSNIRLWALGGVAHIECFSFPLPKEERLIAIAGPAVNFALAILFMPLLFISPLQNVAIFGIFANLILGVFNILPIFPMDGGRLARGIFRIKFPFVEATKWTAITSSIFGSVIFAAFLYKGLSLALVIIPIAILLSWAEFLNVKDLNDNQVADYEYWQQVSKLIK